MWDSVMRGTQSLLFSFSAQEAPSIMAVGCVHYSDGEDSIGTYDSWMTRFIDMP